jgi:hypothetical protein
MIQKLGEAGYEKLRIKSQVPAQLTINDLKVLIVYYEKKLSVQTPKEL